MSLHPEIAAIVDASRASPAAHPSTERIEDRRSSYRQLALDIWPAKSPVASADDVLLETDHTTLRARLYVPETDEGVGLVIFFHGGSFVVGDLDTHDALCRRIAADTQMRLLAVEYRLAPECPFPAAIDDAIAAVRYVAAHVETFADRGARVIVMGDSAGATLAAVAVAHTRNEGLNLAGQALIYPTLGPELLTDSAQRFATGYLLEVESLRFDYEQYLAGWSDHSDTRVSPLMNLDLANSPPAVVVVAEFDPLRDEALAYAGLLEHFGTPVEVLEAEGMVHGFLRLGGLVPEALAVVDDLALHLKGLVRVSAT